MTKYLLISAAALAGLSSIAEAQDQSQPPPQSGLRGNWLQADMTRVQAQQMADGLFQRLDLNHDGTLTRQEVEQARSQMGGGDRAERMIARMFGSAQSVTQAQFEAQALARFDRQDLNHDGTVTAAERQQARSARQQGN